jgi:hypothetical protein
MKPPRLECFVLGMVPPSFKKMSVKEPEMMALDEMKYYQAFYICYLQCCVIMV